MTKYFDNWTSREDVVNDFFPYYDWADNEREKWPEGPPPEDFPSDEEILIAWYDTREYSGSSLVVFERDGLLYEVHGSHCSCYGLEGQWKPEETSAQALGMRKLGKEEEYWSDYGPQWPDEAVTLYHELFPVFIPLDHEPRP